MKPIPDPSDIAWRAVLRRSTVTLAVLTTIATAGMALYGGGWRTVAAAIGRLSLPCLFATLLAVGIEWITDAARFAVVGRAQEVMLSWAFWFRLALVNLFAAYVGNVGAPVSAYLLTRRGIDRGQALALALAKQSLFLPAALGPVLLLVLLHPELAPSRALRATIWSAGGLSLLVILFLGLLALAPDAALRIADRFTNQRLQESTKTFVSANRAFFCRPRLLALSLLLAIVNQAALVAISVVLLRGVGADGSVARLCGQSYLLSTFFQVAPTPGGAGVELAGIWLLRSQLTAVEIAVYLAVWRFFSCQLPICVGAIFLAREMQTDPR